MAASSRRFIIWGEIYLSRLINLIDLVGGINPVNSTVGYLKRVLLGHLITRKPRKVTHTRAAPGPPSRRILQDEEAVDPACWPDSGNRDHGSVSSETCKSLTPLGDYCPFELFIPPDPNRDWANAREVSLRKSIVLLPSSGP